MDDLSEISADNILCGSKWALYIKPAMGFTRKRPPHSAAYRFGRINPCYPDTHGDTPDSIFYTGNGRRGDQKLDAQNRARFTRSHPE